MNEKLAHALAQTLVDRNLRVVFAESCTAGLVAATLATIPGISERLCGSAVTYRNRTKQDWLGVSGEDIERHTAVSEPVARQMAIGVLQRTVEADCSASVTGHLGPDAPADQDGVIFVAVALKQGEEIRVCHAQRFQLTTRTRAKRQQEAAEIVLRCLREQLED